MTQHWPDELWPAENASGVPFTPNTGPDPQNGVQGFLVVCARCDGDIDAHPTPGCGLTRNQLLEIDPDNVHDHCYGGDE